MMLSGIIEANAAVLPWQYRRALLSFVTRGRLTDVDSGGFVPQPHDHQTDRLARKGKTRESRAGSYGKQSRDTQSLGKDVLKERLSSTFSRLTELYGSTPPVVCVSGHDNCPYRGKSLPGPSWCAVARFCPYAGNQKTLGDEMYHISGPGSGRNVVIIPCRFQ